MSMAPTSEKIILITGATDGIGKLTSQRLALTGANVNLHGRNMEKGLAVRDEIRKSSGNPNVEFLFADFSSLQDVRHLGKEINRNYDRLDVLVNNAGVLPVGKGKPERHLSAQGYDLCFCVNYLAPFLLTHLLLPLLHAAPAARIINVASAAQEALDFEDLMTTRNYNPMRAYARSKLALAMFTFELHRRIEHESTTVNCLHPGSLLDTKMVRQAFSEPLGSAESGAEAMVHLTIDPELENVSGIYFDRKSPSRAHPQAYDRHARQLLWNLSMQLTGIQEA